MATILANQNGDWDVTATWIGGVVPGAGDVAVANTRTVTVNVSVTCTEIRNDTTGGATAGGSFSLSDGITLTGNVYAGDLASAVSCATLASTNIATINGVVTGNGYGPGSTGIAAGIYGVNNTGTGTLYVKQTVQGSLGMPAIAGLMQFIDITTASAKVRATSGYTEITLRNMDYAGVLPAPSDVKKGVTYADGMYTGTLTDKQNHIDMSLVMNGAY